MTIATIHPSSLKGEIMAAASKSSMQRACAAALAARGTSVIHNPGHSNDDLAALDIIRKMGARVKMESHTVTIQTEGLTSFSNTDRVAIHCGESGLSIRMFTPLVALSNAEVTINGSGSLVTRPMDFFDEVLPKLGVSVQSNDGKLPLVVKGPLQPRDIEIDGSLSSQFLTGLLLAYAAADASDVTITVTNLKSRPYVDLTLEVMKQFGLKLPKNEQYQRFHFGKESLEDSSDIHDYTVEGDWSGGAFLLVAGAIAGPLVVKGLDTFSTQADKAILNALNKCGVGLNIDRYSVELTPASMTGFEFDATDCPDLFPPLVALAAYCHGDTAIKGVSRLAHKESNRGLTLQEEFGKMGVAIDLEGDNMVIHGQGVVNGSRVHSRHDHRIAMACAVAALRAQTAVTIEEADAVNKSYPDFYKHLTEMGAVVSLSTNESIHQH